MKAPQAVSDGFGSRAGSVHRGRSRGRALARAAVLGGWLVLAVVPAGATCLTDVNGPDDEAGQKDLSQICLLGTCTGGVNETLSFDDVSWSGNNTGDACFLFDTDADGLTNRAVCVTLTGDPAIPAGNPICYTCGDTRPDRCTGSVVVGCTSTCSLTFTADPFALNPSHTGNKCHGTNCRTIDATPNCCLTPADGGGGVLIDVCSYPSQQPNSDPSDCVVNTTCSTNSQCDDGNPCTTDACDTSFGGCVHTAGNAGTQCRAPAGVCDAAEYCDGTNIFCPNDGFTTGGVCRNANGVCDVAETCNGTGPDCPADGYATGGVCRPAANQCDAPESCNGTSPACPPDLSLPNGTSCNDNNACTTPDVCTGGTCGGTAITCNDSNVCTDDGCNPASGCTYVNNNAPCSDGNACTGPDACAGGTCVGGPAPDCNDNNVCTTDGCNPGSGCTHVNNSVPCSDGDNCTENDACAGGSCVPGPAPSCDDGNLCTTDSCVSPGGCQHVPVPSCCTTDAQCADTDLCTASEECVAGDCVSVPVVCDDGNPCTTDGCNPGSGCTFVNNSDPCDDGSACTDGDACANGSCEGATITCNDNNVCTDDGCNPLSGCAYTNNTLPCSDGDACTQEDTCGGGVCEGEPVTCDDGNPCTDDVCIPPTGCASTNNTAPCDDGNPCTGEVGDLCAGGLCVPGAPKNCNDFDLCTDDTCNPQTGDCEHLDNAAPCDDGDFCTDGDHCLNDSCIGAFPHDCNDTSGCTIDSCSSTMGCQHDPVPGPCCTTDADCADTDACTTNEHCDNNQCVSDPVDCTDTDPCTVDFCDSFGGFGCQHPNCLTIAPCPGVNCVCPPQCIPSAACGNGVLDPGETCDPPDPTPIPGTNPAQATCRIDCTFCGDSVVQGTDGEVCDTGTTAVGCNHRGFPNDPTPPPAGPCQNICTRPVCKDPTTIRLGPIFDKYTFHGRLAVGGPVDFAGRSLVVEVNSPSGTHVYRGSVLPGVIAQGSAPGRWTYVNKAAAVSGGIGKVKINRRDAEFYQATVVGFGNLLGAQTGMVAHVTTDDLQWAVTGTWVQKNALLWKLLPPAP